MTLSRHAAHSTRRAILAFAVMFAVVLGLKTALAQTEIDITGGRVDPLPIAIAPFLVGGGAEEAGTTINGVITNNLGRSGYFAPIRPGLLHRADQRFQHAAALRRLAADQCQGAGHRPGLSRGRQGQGRVPPVGREYAAAAGGPAVHHHPEEPAPHRASDLRRDLQVAHRHRRLFRHARRLRAGRRAPRASASRNSPSWTRTDTTRARSPMARNWC